MDEEKDKGFVFMVLQRRTERFGKIALKSFTVFHAACT